MAKYGFEGMIKYDIQSKINGHKRDKVAENWVKIMACLYEQNPNNFLELFKSHLSNLTKTAESRHELPSKTPVLVPRKLS